MEAKQRLKLLKDGTSSSAAADERATEGRDGRRCGVANDQVL